MPVDLERLVASVRFDVAGQVAEVAATVELTVDGPTGCPVFDLRQDIGTASLDGRPLPPEALAYTDMGAGHEARMRVVDVACEGGSTHVLSLQYQLGTPAATGAVPVAWSPTGDGVSWDLFMSDLEPGRYLEMWLPANLCHDQLSVELEVEVTGTARPHVLLANGADLEHTPGYAWTVRYPPTFTSLSPLLVLVPSDQVKAQQTTVQAGGRETRVRVARASMGPGPIFTTSRPTLRRGFHISPSDTAGGRMATISWLSSGTCQEGWSTTARRQRASRRWSTRCSTAGSVGA